MADGLSTVANRDALLQQMRRALARWSDFPDEQWATLAALFHLQVAREQEHVVLPGAQEHHLHFVCSGLLRFYYLTEAGQESNKAFISENMLSGSLAAFLLDMPVLYGVQALEPTTMLVARYEEFSTLYDKHPLFDRLGRRFSEWLLIRKELRMRSFLQQRARERYLSLLQEQPELPQRVPQYHLASYLGITEVTLSRLKRSIELEIEG